ncbi:hypothetical protein LDENG_00113970 [Lucifuga dentata]|nr:hypothetical protein LDENG_00113970 [Lucifuga dentata]
MPRYCAVKVCRNRGGAASRQESKRISFYPFPLQDKSRLQKWMDNMKREEWTPSRHQYLCSEHFTEDCFNIRWGIRYLRNTAIPTIFPSIQDETEKKVPTIQRSPKVKTRMLDSNIEPNRSDFSCSKRPIILTRTSKTAEARKTTNDPATDDGAATDLIQVGVYELPAVSNTGVSCHSYPSQVQTAAYDSDPAVASCLATPQEMERCSQEQADSAVIVLHKSLETSVDSSGLHAALGQAFSFVPVEMVQEDTAGCIMEDGGPSEEENISAYEHSYCRPDTDKEQLWNKILSLHAKILALDRKEESTVAKIRALEAEITLLKRDGAVFKEKQKVLEDYISSIFL